MVVRIQPHASAALPPGKAPLVAVKQKQNTIADLGASKKEISLFPPGNRTTFFECRARSLVAIQVTIISTLRLTMLRRLQEELVNRMYTTRRKHGRN